MIALTDASTVTIIIVGFFVFLVLVAVARTVMRRDTPAYRRYRLGIFVERDDDGIDERRHTDRPE